MNAAGPTSTSEPDEDGDGALVARARRHDAAAVAELFRRHHPAALGLARRLSRVDAEDVAAEAFLQVLRQLSAGRGPVESFRGYLLAAVRHEAARVNRLGGRVVVTGDDDVLTEAAPLDPFHMDGLERELVVGAFDALPERWRRVLWQVDVEGLKPHEVAATAGTSANAVSALVYRARGALREAYLAQHVQAVVGDDRRGCRSVRARLPGLVRGHLTARQTTRVGDHLAECAECTSVHLQLREVDERIGAWLVPVVAVGVLSAAGGGGLPVAAATTWVTGALLSLKGSLSSVTTPVAVAAVATTTAVAVVVVPPLQREAAPEPPRSAAPAPVLPTPLPTPGARPSDGADDSGTPVVPSPDATAAPTDTPTSPSEQPRRAPLPPEPETPASTPTPAPAPTPAPPPTGDAPVSPEPAWEVWTVGEPSPTEPSWTIVEASPATTEQASSTTTEEDQGRSEARMPSSDGGAGDVRLVTTSQVVEVVTISQTVVSEAEGPSEVRCGIEVVEGARETVVTTVVTTTTLTTTYFADGSEASMSSTSSDTEHSVTAVPLVAPFVCAEEPPEGGPQEQGISTTDTSTPPA